MRCEALIVFIGLSPRYSPHACSTIFIMIRDAYSTETMLIHDTSQRFGLFEHASMCNQKGGVKIQNRGPEQEIPAVTCVRLIAQKHRY